MRTELLRQLQRYLNGGATLVEVERWLVGRLHLLLDSEDQIAIAVANSVDTDLVEVGEDIVDEAALQDRWARYVEQLEQAATVITDASGVRVSPRPDTRTILRHRSLVVTLSSEGVEAHLAGTAS